MLAEVPAVSELHRMIHGGGIKLRNMGHLWRRKFIPPLIGNQSMR